MKIPIFMDVNPTWTDGRGYPGHMVWTSDTAGGPMDGYQRFVVTVEVPDFWPQIAADAQPLTAIKRLEMATEER